MGHDEHFLGRLDRVHRDQVDLALGLYRDHELVRAILLDARLPPTPSESRWLSKTAGAARTSWSRATEPSSRASARG